MKFGHRSKDRRQEVTRVSLVLYLPIGLHPIVLSYVNLSCVELLEELHDYIGYFAICDPLLRAERNEYGELQSLIYAITDPQKE